MKLEELPYTSLLLLYVSADETIFFWKFLFMYKNNFNLWILKIFEADGKIRFMWDYTVVVNYCNRIRNRSLKFNGKYF